jgi:site-specific DNA recombinase
VREVAKASNAQGAPRAHEHQRLETEKKTIKLKLEGLYDAIAGGLRSPGLKEKLLELEGRVAAIDAKLDRPAPEPVRLNPNLSELYRRRVTELAITLADPAISQPAREVVRGLIERVAVRWEDGQAVVALDGALTALIGLATNAKGPALSGPYGSSVKVVAGAGFGLCRTSMMLDRQTYQPAAFRL